MNITLVNPPPSKMIESHDAPGYPHLGLGYVAGVLKNQGISCSLVDAKFEKLDLDKVGDRLCQQQPDIVGITAMTHEVLQANEVANLTKRILPKTIVVLGGPHATAMPYQTLAEFPNFDIVVFGEGEYTFQELATLIERQESLPEIRGIGYRTGNHIHLNEPRKAIENLAEVPFPAWDLFPKSTTYPVLASRGCPFKCNFCMRVLGSKVRLRPPQNVIEELQKDADTYGASFIHLADETFAINKEHANEILHLMIESGLYKKIRWNVETRVDLADYDLFLKMKAAGCNWIGFGIESGNEEILKATKKGITLNQATGAIKMAKKAGLKTGSFYVIGHPFETYKTAQDTINFAAKCNTTTVAFGTMVPYPGTEIYEMAKVGGGGYKLISSNWAEFNKTIGNSLELEQLSRRDLEKLQLFAYLKFYLSNRRIIDFIKLFIEQRRVLFRIIKRLFRQ